MADKIQDAELRFGDVVLNYCDPRYLVAQHDPNDRRGTPQDHLLRLLAYSLFARRVFVPANYALANRSFFDALSIAPELLSEGILVVHLHEHLSSFSELIQERGYDDERRFRAEFLDKKSKYIKPFSVTDESSLYHQRLLEDILPDGPLRALISGGRRGKNATKLDEAVKLFDGKEGSRSEFVDTVGALVCEHRALIERWAALRYYLTPMELDPVRIRDLPHSAAVLAKKAGVMTVPALEDPDSAGDLPEPMNTAVGVLNVHMPILISPSDARCLVTAVLSTRESVPEAREKFSSVVESARELEVKHELNAALRKALLSERLLPKRAGLSDQFLGSAKNAAVGVLVELILGKVPGAIAMIGGGTLKGTLDDRAQRGRAPWKVSYEVLANGIRNGRGALEKGV